MCSQCVITFIVNEFHPMITLKKNQVFRNKNLLNVSLPRIILLTKHVYFWVVNFLSLTVGFTRLPTLSRAFTVGHTHTHTHTYIHIYIYIYIYITKISRLSPEGISIHTCYYSTQVFMLCEQWNSAELCSTVLIPLINHQGCCLMAP